MGMGGTGLATGIRTSRGGGYSYGLGLRCLPSGTLTLSGLAPSLPHA